MNTTKSNRQVRYENYVKNAKNLEELGKSINSLIHRVHNSSWVGFDIKMDALEVLQLVNPELASGTELHKLIYLGFTKGCIFSKCKFGTEKGKKFLKQLIKLKESDLFDHYKYLKFCMSQEVMRDRTRNQGFVDFMVYFKYFCEQERKSILEEFL